MAEQELDPYTTTRHIAEEHRAELLRDAEAWRLARPVQIQATKRTRWWNRLLSWTALRLEPPSRDNSAAGRESCVPLVKVNLLKGRSTEEKDAIAASIQAALVRTLGVPDEDRYQLFNEYDGESLRHTSGYLGLTYTDQLLIIEMTFLEGRDDELKKSLLAEINRNLVATEVVRGDDVFVLITEIGRANVSFGKGLAQRAPTSPPAG
jgi:phenylpyruvate tautomerase PptA (4-oxalocrotonate tautomerase family)